MAKYWPWSDSRSVVISYANLANTNPVFPGTPNPLPWEQAGQIVAHTINHNPKLGLWADYDDGWWWIYNHPRIERITVDHDNRPDSEWVVRLGGSADWITDFTAEVKRRVEIQLNWFVSF